METEKNRKSRTLKRIMTVLVVVVLAATGLFLWKGDVLVERAVTDKLYERFLNIPSGGYEYSLDSLDIDIYRRSISLRGLMIRPSAGLRDRIRYRNPGMVWFDELSMNSMDVSGLRLLRFIRRGEIIIRRMEVSGPVLSLNLPEETGQDGSEDVRSPVVGSFSQARIERLEIMDAGIAIYDLSRRRKILFRTRDTDLALKKLRIDSGLQDGSVPLDFREISFSSGPVESILPGNHRLRIRRMDYSTIDGFLSADSVMLETEGFTPGYGDYPLDQDAIQAFITELDILGFNPEALLRENTVEAEEIRFNGLDAVCRLGADTASTANGESDALAGNHAGPPDVVTAASMPWEIPLELPVGFSVRNVLVHGSNIRIEQSGPATGGDGSLAITGLKAGLDNLYSDPKKARRRTTSLRLEGRLYDTGAIIITADLHPGNENGGMDLYFRLGSMPFAAFNSLAELNGLITIRSGQVDSLECSLAMGAGTANGKLVFAYHGLRIAVLRETESLKKMYGKRRIVSLAANGMIRNNNDPSGRSFREGKISRDRIPAESFSNYLVSCIVQGLASSMAPGASERLDPEVRAEN